MATRGISKALVSIYICEFYEWVVLATHVWEWLSVWELHLLLFVVVVLMVGFHHGIGGGGGGRGKVKALFDGFILKIGLKFDDRFFSILGEDC